MRRIQKTVAVSLATLTATAMMSAAATPALAAPGAKGPSVQAGDNRNNATSEKLRAATSAEGGLVHLQAFQDIADAHGGTRASGTDGYDASVDYVVSRLQAAGYAPEVQAFDFPFFQETAPAQLLLDGQKIDTGTYTYSGSADLVGTIIPVDVQVPPPPPAAGQPNANTTTSGCEDADFAGLDFSGATDVALIQRGTCPFGQKALNAQEAGAEAVVIFNEGQPGRTALQIGTLGAPAVTIPVIGASHDAGKLLLAAAGRTGAVTLSASTISEFRETYNVIAQTSGRTDNVVMAGAHLDSVVAGPGINDNGSGSAGILEVAEAFAKTQPTNAVRFAWWGAEELGLLGSEHYVEQLDAEEAEDIALYLNFDMIASPNFARMVYDGDDSDKQGSAAGPAGSAQIEELFTGFFSQQGLNTKATDFSGRSDYGPFIAIGIPSGGLFTGAEEIATVLDNTLFGSTVGVAYDPNYHQAGDTIENVDLTVFGQNIDAIAHAVISYGYSTSTVNAEPGNEDPRLTAVSGPGGGIAAGEGSAGGGGLREGHFDHAAEEAGEAS